MRQGEVLLLPANKIRKIVIGNSRSLRVKDLKGKQSKISVTAIGPGESSLTVLENRRTYTHSFTVLSKKIDETYHHLKKTLKGESNIKISTNRNRIYLSGETSSLYELNRLNTLSENRAYLVNTVKLDRKSVKKEGQNLIKLLNSLNKYSYNLKYLDGLNKLFVDIQVVKKSEIKTLKKLIEKYKLITIFETSPKTYDPNTISVEIKFLEVKDGFEEEFGYKWNNSIELLPLSPKINSLLTAYSREGKAKDLASPKLLCSNNSEASFLAGGHIPIKIINSKNRSHIVWKKYGIELKFKPHLTENRDIHLKVSINVSSLDYSNAIGSIPAISTRSVETSITIESGKTFFLSGLVRNTKGKNTEGVPYLKGIPIIGELFRSKNFIENKSELIVLISPKLAPKKEGKLELKTIKGKFHEKNSLK